MSLVIDTPVFLPTSLEGDFKILLGKHFASESEWLREKRKISFNRFSRIGIPTRRNESYKYTDLKKIFSKNFTAIPSDEFQKSSIDIRKIAVDSNSTKIIFINGQLFEKTILNTKLPEGVIVENMSGKGILQYNSILKQYFGTIAELSDDGLSLLNNAIWTDGAFIHIPEKIIIENPIEIIHISIGQQELLSNPRHLIVIGKNASAQIIEHSISINTGKQVLVNSLAEVFVGENAKLQYYRVQNDCKDISQLSTIYVKQERNSHFDTNTISLGNDFVRNNLNIAQEGENCETHLNGLFIIKAGEFVDNHTAVQHNKPNCQSNQLYKGILDEHATGVFNGRIFVARDAQKTNAYQSSKNILLSDDASINTKPELEIYADDVKCSHGSSTGKLDEEAIFYLRTRGLGETGAKRLLLYAFAMEVLNTIKADSLKTYLEELININLGLHSSEKERSEKYYFNDTQ